MLILLVLAIAFAGVQSRPRQRRSDGSPGNDRMKTSGHADVSEGKGQSAFGDAGQKVTKITKKLVGKR